MSAVVVRGTNGLARRLSRLSLAHQPEHPFGVDDQALPAQRVGEAAIAVMAMGERFALDEVAQVGVLASGGVGRANDSSRRARARRSG